MNILLEPDEVLIMSLKSDAIVLTNKRMLLLEGPIQNVIDVKKITAMEAQVKHSVLKFLGSILFFLAGFGFADEIGKLIGILMAAGLLMVYFIFPERNLIIGIGDEEILYNVNRFKHSDITKLCLFIQEEIKRCKL